MRVFPRLEDQLKNRHYVTESVEVQSIYDRHQNYLEQLYRQEGLLALVGLEQRLLELSLNEQNSPDALENALITVSPHRRRTFTTREESQFLRELYDAFHALWCRPPWCHSHFVIYDVTRKLYSHGHLIVEIAYSDLPPACLTSPAPARTRSYP